MSFYYICTVLSYTEENYLKALLSLTGFEKGNEEAGTNELALQLGVKPATANDMLKKLREKGYLEYEKYGKIRLSDTGRQSAILVLRKHRLWETFLHQKLEFTWDEVHEVAEQMEHIQSEKLIEKLDWFLSYPQFDPHGDPIPNAAGQMPGYERVLLSELELSIPCRVAAVKNTSPAFLQYLGHLGIGVGTILTITTKVEFDSSLQIQFDNRAQMISSKFAENLWVELFENPNHCE